MHFVETSFGYFFSINFATFQSIEFNLPDQPPNLKRLFAVSSMGSKRFMIASGGRQWLQSHWMGYMSELGHCWASMSLCWFGT